MMKPSSEEAMLVEETVTADPHLVSMTPLSTMREGARRSVVTREAEIPW
jgi:hypothetical protein